MRVPIKQKESTDGKENINNEQKKVKFNNPIMNKRFIKTLIIGCGGLGCELVKILNNFKEFKITLIDHDTIDITNLNRQFYFTKETVGEYKSKVLAEKFGYYFYTDRIEEVDGGRFWESFDIVFNCLDNNEARSFVNQRCYLYNKMLIDGGSAGWLGQSYAFTGQKECFDCLPKKFQEVFPICTVRSVPSTFKHCLAFGKLAVEENMLDEKEVVEEITDIVKNYMEKVEQNYLQVKKENAKNPDFENNIDLQRFSMDKLKKMNRDNRIYFLGMLRAAKFDITPTTFMDATTFLNKTIPSICTTNAIVASAMVKSAYNLKNYFLVGSLIQVNLKDKNKECTTCSLPNYVCKYNKFTKLKSIYDKYGYTKLYVDDKEILLENVKEDATFKEMGYKIGLLVKNGYKARVYFDYANTNRHKFGLERVK